jgi:hypothetical protein
MKSGIDKIKMNKSAQQRKYYCQEKLPGSNHGPDMEETKAPLAVHMWIKASQGLSEEIHC